MPNVPPAGPLGHFWPGFRAQRPTHWTVGPLLARISCPTSHPLDRWATFGLVLVPNVPPAGPLDHFRPDFHAQRPIHWTVGPLLPGFSCPTSHPLDRWTTFARVFVPNVPPAGPLDHFWAGFGAQRPIHWTVGPLLGWFWCPTSHPLDRWTTFLQTLKTYSGKNCVYILKTLYL